MIVSWGPGGARSGVGTLLLPLVYVVAVDPIFSILTFFQFAALLSFLALFMTVAHEPLRSLQFKGLRGRERPESDSVLCSLAGLASLLYTQFPGRGQGQ